MSLPFELQKKYNFNTLAPAILGNNFKNAIVQAIVGYSIAKQFISPETQNVNVYPALPPGVVADPKKYTYVVFLMESGIERVFALEWIDISSIVEVSSQTLTIQIANTSAGDAERVRQALLLLQLTSFTVTSS